MGIIKIEDKKELLVLIKRENNLRDAFQQQRTNISELFGFGITVSWYV